MAICPAEESLQKIELDRSIAVSNRKTRKLVQGQQSACLYKIPPKFPDSKERLIHPAISLFPCAFTKAYVREAIDFKHLTVRHLHLPFM